MICLCYVHMFVNNLAISGGIKYLLTPHYTCIICCIFKKQVDIFCVRYTILIKFLTIFIINWTPMWKYLHERTIPHKFLKKCPLINHLCTCLRNTIPIARPKIYNFYQWYQVCLQIIIFVIIRKFLNFSLYTHYGRTKRTCQKAYECVSLMMQHNQVTMLFSYTH